MTLQKNSNAFSIVSFLSKSFCESFKVIFHEFETLLYCCFMFLNQLDPISIKGESAVLPTLWTDSSEPPSTESNEDFSLYFIYLCLKILVFCLTCFPIESRSSSKKIFNFPHYLFIFRYFSWYLPWREVGFPWLN